MASTIPSPTPTLPSSPVSGHAKVAPSHQGATTPLETVSTLASEHSSVLAVFDTAKLAGFPLPAASKNAAQVWDLQSRAGAGSSVVGFLKSEGAQRGATVLASTPTFPLLLPALANLPEETTAANRIVVHLSVALPAADEPLSAVSPSLAQVTPLLPLVPEGFTVVFSATAGDIVANTQAIYAAGLQDVNVLHVFDGVFAARELVRPASVAPKAAEVEAFSYQGEEGASKVIVLAAGYTSSILKAATLAPSVGVLTLNALSTSDASILEALPHGGKDVAELVVVDEEASAVSFLKDFVFGNVFGRAGTSSGKLPKITGASIKGGESSLENLLYSIGITAPLPSSKTESAALKQTVFYTAPSSLLPSVLTKTFLSSPSLSTRVSTLTSLVPAVAQSTVVISPAGSTVGPKPFTSVPKANSSEVVYVASAGAVQVQGALASLKTGGTVVFSIAGWEAATVAENLTAHDRQLLAAKKARVFVLPPRATKDGAKLPAEQQEAEDTALGLVGFFLLYAGVGEAGQVPAGVRGVLAAALGPALEEFINVGEQAFKEVSTAGFDQVDEDQEDDKRSALVLDGLTSFPVVDKTVDAHAPLQASWHVPALHLLFKEAFAPVTEEVEPTIAALAPSIPEKTYLATVSENRRLTPSSYDRNVFHLELSTAGTGLKYDVGEALGVHGWNEEEEVLDFLAWYGVEPSAILSVPVGGKVETRTALQVFQQNVDIFGRPPKGFYASLVGKTDDREEARTLRFISSAEGSSMFKKWSENETVTFVDVLKRFPGLKKNIPIEDLVHLVGEIHPRHYSISSAQKFVGDSVHLLVVTVEWNASTGKPRFGQCTRYLAGLKVGQKVTVSIKPSVMKLPPLDTQPVIMAGLGTGAAPFRAFIQHRAWQKSQGIAVGPLYYYFGSRYSSQEYLYGEEIEAYLRAGLLTHAGLAFSRDTKEKVYIQHKMLEDGPLLSDILTAKEEANKAYFYLCGPTWPVPDVYEALVGSLTENKNYERVKAEELIEEWKEEERYVLEVY